MPATPIDEAELQSRVEGVVADAAPGSTVAPLNQLQGGTSSITYWTIYTPPGREPQKVVVKVAPAGLDPVWNRDVLRQARLQRALQGTAVPAPAVIGEHPGSPPEIPPFFIMTFEVGDCVEPNSLPDPLPADDLRQRELHAARILGALHALDPDKVGLGDEPATALDAEVARWIKSLNSCDEDLRGDHEAVGEQLAASLPAAVPPTMMHGDFRLGNTLSHDGEVIAVIDWEIWTLGDPRVDVAWFLLMANPDKTLGRPVAPGMPSNDELLEQYEQGRGDSVKDLEWFAALVRYKQAAAAALIARNARRRGQEVVGANNGALLASARELLGIG
jgi:aminoglycoside phosphotransferase (APT) family kinase protein